MDKIVFDKVSFKDSVRTIDDNGFLHVAVSNITKEQVAPYLGSEIPNFERLGLKPDSIYKVYRPAEELEKAVKTSDGIPIQLDHHADYADAPAKETRVGSTGTDGRFNAPYLQNSLHIQDADAIKRINDGSMRELSLGYRYTPEKKSGVFNGEPYDLIMRDISCNHLALVEEGRAGHDVLVKDSKSTLNEVQKMSDKVEKMEIALADQMISTANMLKDLHKTDAMGNVVDITKDEEISTMEDKLNEFLAKLEEAGIDKDEARAKIEEIINAKSEVKAEDEDLEKKEDLETKEEISEDDDLTDKEEIESEEDLGEDEDLEEESQEEEKETLNFDEDQKHGLDACGLDSEDPIVQKAFAEGVKYGEKKEKEEPKHLDSLHESEGEKRALGEDSIAKIVNAVKQSFANRYKAVEECKRTLGKVDAMAFDNAGAVYRKACNVLGLKTKGMTAKECRALYRGYMASNKSTVVGDSKKSLENDRLEQLLGNVKDSI